MADKEENNFDPIEGLRYVHLARVAYPELYQQLAFDQVLAKRGLRWDLTDSAFVKALEEFAQQFLDYLKNNPELNNELNSLVPREMVEKAVSETSAYPTSRAEILASKYVELANKKARARQIEIANEEAVKKAVSESLVSASQTSKMPEDFSKNAGAAIAQRGDLAGQIDSESLTTVINERAKEIPFDKERASSALQSSIASDVARPDIYARVRVKLQAEEPAASEVYLEKNTRRLTDEAAVFLSEPKEGVGQINFFRGFAEEGSIQKGFAPVMDIAMDLVGPQNRDTIMGAIVGKSLNQAVQKPDPKLGDFTRTPAYAEIVRAGQGALAHPPQVREKSFVKRLVTRATMTGAIGRLAGNPDQTVKDVFRLAKFGVFSGEFNVPAPKAPAAAAPKISAAVAVPVVMIWSVPKIYLAAAYARFPLDFHIDFNGLAGWMFHLGAQKVGEKAVSGLITKGAATLGVKAAGTAIGGALGTAFGGPVGTVVMGALTGFALSLPGKVVGLFKKAAGMVGLEPSFLSDLPLAIAVFAVSIVILTIYFPLSFLPFNNFADKVRTTALETSGERALGGGATANLANFSYPNIPLPPASGISRNPIVNVPGAFISQGPNQGNHTGSEANSYDIAVPNGTPVYPTHGGVVVDLVQNFVQGQHVLDSAGNFVRLEGVDSSGQTYFTTYEHLLGLAPNIVVGSRVTPDTLLGYSDDTGNSTGPHLHYQCNGSACVNMLPGGTY